MCESENSGMNSYESENSGIYERLWVRKLWYVHSIVYESENTGMNSDALLENYGINTVYGPENFGSSVWVENSGMNTVYGSENWTWVRKLW